MIKTENVCKTYDDNEILKNINLEIKEGEFVAIMGQSGCGKSTLLYCISGMDHISSGEVFYEDKKLTDFKEKELENLRLKKMGFIFQKPNFLKNLSIEDNIVFPAFQLGSESRKNIVNRAEKLMEKMNIKEIANHDIRKVSGGQLQRAAICRAMINQPDILFGDEPTGALNSSATMEVMDILNQINRQGTAIMLVTHDSKVAVRADRVIYLEDGSIKEELVLGKYKSTDLTDREKKLKELLERVVF